MIKTIDEAEHTCILNAPASIYLQTGCPIADRGEALEFDTMVSEDLTWCPDQIEECDLEYRRVDLVEALEAENASLSSKLERVREAARNLVDKCWICNGTGENRDAMQAWDMPEAPVPDCHYCLELRSALDAVAETEEENISGDNAASIGS